MARPPSAPLPRLRPLEILNARDEDGSPLTVLRDPEGFSAEELVLSEAALLIAAHCDGEHTLEDATAAFAARYGRAPDPSQVQGLLDRLNGAWFFENEAFAVRREETIRAFLDLPSRPFVHAEPCYAAEPTRAEELVRGYFIDAPAAEDGGAEPAGRLAGLIAPHIDLRVGGPLCALVYRRLAEATAVDTVIVLGTAHHWPRPGFSVYSKPYETPLGAVPVDEEACARLAAASGADPSDAYYHRSEHSIEFQALFLAALRRTGRPIRMTAVLCGPLPDEEPPGVTAFLGELRAVLRERGGSALVVAAADLAHVGPRFGDPEPLGAKHLALLEAKDRETLGHVVDGNAEGFRRSARADGDPRRICGLSPIYGVLRVLDQPRGRLLGYEQANDETGTVTYAGLEFRA